jgi:hypothetical protein
MIRSDRIQTACKRILSLRWGPVNARCSLPDPVGQFFLGHGQRRGHVSGDERSMLCLNQKRLWPTSERPGRESDLAADHGMTK